MKPNTPTSELLTSSLQLNKYLTTLERNILSVNILTMNVVSQGNHLVLIPNLKLVLYNNYTVQSSRWTNNLHKVCNVSAVKILASPDRMRVLISFDNLFHYAASLTLWLPCPAWSGPALIIVIVNYKLHFHLQHQSAVSNKVSAVQFSPIRSFLVFY